MRTADWDALRALAATLESAAEVDDAFWLFLSHFIGLFAVLEENGLGVYHSANTIDALPCCTIFYFGRCCAIFCKKNARDR